MKKCPKCGFENMNEGDECPRCGIIYDRYRAQKQINPDRNSAPPNEPAQKVKPHPISRPFLLMIGSILVLFVVLMGWGSYMDDGVLIDLSKFKSQDNYSGAQKPAPKRSGKTVKDYGILFTDPGSAKQAKMLLSQIQTDPTKNEYQIIYKIDDEVVILGCVFDKEVIARMHNYSNGHGTAEMWQGHIQYRLQSAAGGGSLNDIPNGKAMGSFQTF